MLWNVLVLLSCIALATSDPLLAFPIWKATLYPNSPDVPSWNSPCFEENSAVLNLTFGERAGRIHFTARKKVERLCHDTWLIADEDQFFIKEIEFEGTHTIDIGEWTDGELEDVEYFGLQIFLITDGMVGEIEDMYQFFQYFKAHDNDTADMLVEFLETYGGFTFELRPEGNQVFIPDEKDIKSGDYFAITDLYKGLGMLIQYGTGSRTSHTAVALWNNDELFVCESTDPNIICTPYQEWMSRCHEDSPYLLSILRLAPEYQSQFDEKAAWEFAQTMVGLPYGYQNFIFGWIDTPSDNYPWPMSSELLQVAFPVVEKINPEWAIIYLDSFNLRMGTNNLTTEDIFHLLEERNMSFDELMNMVERDDFVYPRIPSPGRAVTCDSFVMSVYKAAGVLGEFTDYLQASEFTPKDSYQIALFDSHWQKPSGCPQEFPYCQVTGKYWQTLDGFNSIPMYRYMNEHCGALPTAYARLPEGC